jgi:hypothetical protein
MKDCNFVYTEVEIQIYYQWEHNYILNFNCICKELHKYEFRISFVFIQLV